MFEEYLDEGALATYIKKGICWKTKLRLVGSGGSGFVSFPKDNRTLYTEDGYVISDAERNLDVLLPDTASINRAFPNDNVYVQLLPRKEWVPRQFGLENAYDIDVKGTEEEEKVLQPRGKVVKLAENCESYNRCFVCLMQLNRNSDTNNNELGDNDRHVRMVCVEKNVPWLLCDVNKLKQAGYIEGNQIKTNMLYEVRRVRHLQKYPLGEGEVVGVIGRIDKFECVLEMITKQYGLDDVIKETDEALEIEAQSIVDIDDKNTSMNGRADFRKSRTVFTIDPETARDLDDAIHIRKLRSKEVANFNSQKPANAIQDELIQHFPIDEDPVEVYELGVHIADVSHYVQCDSGVDRDAAKRTTSVYFPHIVYPMLPKILSNKLCSLHPGDDKLTMSITFHVERSTGALLLEQNGYPVHICRSVISSQARLSYEEAQCIIDGFRGGSFQYVLQKYSRHSTLFQHKEFHKSLTDPKSISWSTTWQPPEIVKLLVALDMARTSEVTDSNCNDEIYVAAAAKIAKGATFADLNRTEPQNELAKYLELARQYMDHVNRKTIPRALQEYRDASDKRWENLLSWDAKERENFLLDVYIVDSIMQKVKTRREANGAGTFNNESLTFQWRGYPVKVVPDRHSSSHECIQEMMLMANKLVARFCVNSKSGRRLAVLRSHHSPDSDKVAEINAFLRHVGYTHIIEPNDSARNMVAQLKLASFAANLSKALNGWLKTCLSPANYERLLLQEPQELDDMNLEQQSVDNEEIDDEYVYNMLVTGHYRHWALAFPIYTHFTSPIRRYADILVHRCVTYILSHADEEGYESYLNNRPVPTIGSTDSQYGPHTQAYNSIGDVAKQRSAMRRTLDFANSYRLNVERASDKMDQFMVVEILRRNLSAKEPVALGASAIAIYHMDRCIKIYIPTLAMLTNLEFRNDYNKMITSVEPKIWAVLTELLPEFEDPKLYPVFKSHSGREPSLHWGAESMIITCCARIELVLVPIICSVCPAFIPVSRRSKKKLVSLVDVNNIEQ